MRETLYIRLRPGAPPQYRVDGPQNAGRTDQADLDAVLAQAAGRRIVAFVSGTDVRLTAAAVPVRSRGKVLQAVPFALEDQLAEDVETLHFAIAPRQPDGAFPVAVVARDRMEAWLAPFYERGLRPEMLVPETLCLPDAGDARWGALAEPATVTVRTGPYTGFCCKAGDFEAYLALADPDQQHPLRILLPLDNPADYTRLERPAELLPGFPTALDALLRDFDPRRALNLLQGCYSQQEDLRRLWLPWRAAAALVAAWLVLALAGNGIAAWRLGRELRAQDDANLARFHQLFPTETRVVDLAAQAEQQYRLLHGGAAQPDLFLLLQRLAEALGANAGLTLDGLQFRDGALYLSLTGKDLQTLENLRTWFSQSAADVNLDVQSANAGAEGVQIRLKLSRA